MLTSVGLLCFATFDRLFDDAGTEEVEASLDVVPWSLFGKPKAEINERTAREARGVHDQHDDYGKRDGENTWLTAMFANRKLRSDEECMLTTRADHAESRCGLAFAE